MSESMSLIDAVARHIEPITRFGREDLTLVCESEGLCVVRVEVSRCVRFRIDRSENAGRLPAACDRLVGSSTLEQHGIRLVATAERELEDCLAAWAARPASVYRKLLPQSACVRSVPASFGTESVCTNCHGATTLPCHHCATTGSVLCFACSGSGRRSCGACNGTKRVRCTGCHGSGQRTEYVTTNQWDAAKGVYVTDTHSQQTSCTSCYGSGSVPCTACDSGGMVQCQSCLGRGNNTCGVCHGIGRFACTTCRSTGSTHVLCVFCIAITLDETLAADTDDPLLAAIVEERVGVPHLGEVASLTHAADEVSGDHAVSRYTMHLDYARVTIMAAGRSLVFHGLSQDRRILDFVDIGNVLLEADLVRLESAGRHSSPWRMAASGPLLAALHDFLPSEINLLISELVQPTAPSGNVSDEDRALLAHVESVVDSHYRERATGALRLALQKLYGIQLFKPALAIVSMTAALAGLDVVLQWPPVAGLVRMGAIVAVACIAWFVVEFVARRRISERCPRPSQTARSTGSLQTAALAAGAS